jgi:type II secretory pathway pseudopilin PulG
MIELLTVLVVLGVLASMAGPRIDFQYYAVNGAEQAVSSTLLRAQRQAVQEQHPVVIAFDAAADALRIHDDINGNLQVDPGEGVQFEHLADGVAIARGSAPSIFPTDADVTFAMKQDGLPAVVFYRNGSVSEEGGFYLASASSLTDPAKKPHTRAARIQRATGRAEWLRYVGSEWERE